MDFGPRKTAAEVVVAWLVDDGVAKRMHRNNILEERLIFCGVSAGSHKEADACVVAVFAAQVVSKNIQQVTAAPGRQIGMEWSRFCQEIFDIHNKIRQ